MAQLQPGIAKGQTLAEVRRLLEGEPETNRLPYSGEEIVACARFLQTDPWRIEKMVPLTTRHILERIEKWRDAGRPQTWAEWQAKIRSAPAAAQAIPAYKLVLRDLDPKLRKLEDREEEDEEAQKR